MIDTKDKIMLAAGSKDDACRWYRMTIPYNHINSDQLVWADEFAAASGKVEINWSDLLALKAIVIQRPVNDTVFTMVAHLAAQSPRPKIIVELDDDLWMVPSHNPARSYYNKKRIKNLQGILDLADRVIVSTPRLAMAVTFHGQIPTDRIYLVRNTLPADTPFINPADVVPNGRLVFSGSQTHRADLMQVSKSVRSRPGTTLLGHDYRDLLPKADFLGWTTNVPAHYARLRGLSGSIGLAPLEENTFNASKSAIRLMEYAAAGIAPLASPYGPYLSKPVPQVTHGRWDRAVDRLSTVSTDYFRELLTVAQNWARGRVMDDMYLTNWKVAWMVD